MEKDPYRIKEQSKKYLKYSSLAFQMLSPILIGVLLGKYLDTKYNGEGLYLALVSVFSVLIAIYLGIKDLINPK